MPMLQLLLPTRAISSITKEQGETRSSPSVPVESSSSYSSPSLTVEEPTPSCLRLSFPQRLRLHLVSHSHTREKKDGKREISEENGIAESVWQRSVMFIVVVVDVDAVVVLSPPLSFRRSFTPPSPDEDEAMMTTTTSKAIV